MHKWTSAIEGIEQIAVDEWAVKLAGLTGEQIKFGLQSWVSDWPPSADEFRKCCTGSGLNEFGMDYTPEYYRRETRPERILESDTDKNKRKEAATSGIAAMRAALKRTSD